jgi:hypothetical protein
MHSSAFDVDGLYWYYGVGGHISFMHGYDKHPWFNDGKDHVVLGIDGIVGMEYKPREIPITFSLDYKPAFNIWEETGLWMDDVSVSIRYVW